MDLFDFSGSKSPIDIYEYDDEVELYCFAKTPIVGQCGVSALLEGYDINPVSRAAELAAIFDDEEIALPFDSEFLAKTPDAMMLPGCQVLYKDVEVSYSNNEIVVSRQDICQVIPRNVVSAYFGAGCHLSVGNSQVYTALVKCGLSSGAPIPSRSHSDGQLKILVDFFIGIDQWITRHYGTLDAWRSSQTTCRILVIGSAGESGVSGTSYGILPFLPGLFRIDMWDSFENNGTQTIGNTIYSRHRGYYDYNLGFENYDIVFDDAYNIHEFDRPGHANIDPGCKVLCASDYSVKWLPADDDIFAGQHRYSQAAKINEDRAVKYPRLYGRCRPIGVGSCSLCVELRYMIRLAYPRAVYDYVLTAHKKCCIGGYQTLSRAVRFRNECCLRGSTLGLPRVNVCNAHKSSFLVRMVRMLSPTRELYPLGGKLDFDKIAARDVVIEAYSSGGNAIIVEVPRVVSAVARSLVIQFKELYFVSVLMPGEIECKSNQIFYWRE